jgi:predicted ATPase
MLTSVSVLNVRLFADEPRTFRLAPLTVFCGSNSSGKSTILKVLPLLRQSQGIRESAEEESGKLRFKGTQVDLGNYSTLVSNNDTSRQMCFEIRITESVPSRFLSFLNFMMNPKLEKFDAPARSTDDSVDLEFACSFEFLADAAESSASPKSKQETSNSGTLHTAEFSMIANGKTILDWSLKKLEFAAEKSAIWSGISDEPSESFYELLMPEEFFKKSGLEGNIVPQKSSAQGKVSLIALLRGLLPTAFMVDAKSESTGEEADTQHNWQKWPLHWIFEMQFNLFKNALLNVHYVAPLRSPGKRYYIADLDVTPGMDPTGEFLPYILRDRGSVIVENALPTELGRVKEESLALALGGWLHYLRTGSFTGAESKQTEFELSTAHILVELRLKSQLDEHKHSLADSGFGYSQIVPVLVRGLLTPRDGTLVVEQPELHLHPALQVRIADFFLSMCSIGKQVILETHSEHLVNTLRVRAAEDPENFVHKLCKIYFLSTDSEKPQVYDLSVRSDGSLNEWPESFFGEALSLSGRLLRAQMKNKPAAR